MKTNNLTHLFRTNSKYNIPTIFGRNEKDIFLGTSEGIEHYTGTDIQLLLSSTGWVNEGLLFNKEIILLNSMTPNGDLIIHGKLE